MMKTDHLLLRILILVLFVTLVAGCAPTGDEPAAAPLEAQDDASAEESGSGLATMPPAQAVEVTETPVETLEEAIQLEETQDSSENSEEEEAATEPDQSEAVTPAVIDLSRLTPEPPLVSATPRVIHAPGIPNPSAAASNRAAVNLADSLELDVDEVEVLAVEQVEWRDSSLGCPKPGQSYLTVITPGFRVILQAQGKQFEYHTNQDGTVLVQCEGGAGSGAGSVDR